MANYPPTERKEGLRAFTAPYIQFYGVPYARIGWAEQGMWRSIVNEQPIAVLCRETIIESVATIDWRIEPKDPLKRQELRTESEYYEKMFEQNNGLDWVSQVEWILGDALDLPFGYGEELVYREDDPNKRLLDFIPLDGATLMPTYNRDYPVVQYVPDAAPAELVVFPEHAINRLYYSPRREIVWRGWGTPPPEKIYLALLMLVQGDRYYWKMLIDTPEAGILDLIDMDKESAEQWLDSLRTLMAGMDPLKVPVLYEHETAAKFIPFGRPPSEIMYDETTRKYAAITAAGYGLSLSDIGFGGGQNGGNTLAGSIREERGSKRKGIGFAKIKVRLFMNRRLPKNLKFVWVDPDEEQQVARGRALLSSATSFTSLITSGVIGPNEARQMLIAGGLSPTTLPEQMPEEEKALRMEFQQPQGAAGKPPQRQNMLTASVPPSVGGQGEVRASMVDKTVEDSVTAYLSEVTRPEALELPEEEYQELLLSHTLFGQEVIDSLSEHYQEVFEQQKKTKSLFSRDRYRAFDEGRVRALVSRSVWDAAINVASMLVQAKSDALDKSEQISDNFVDIAEQIVLELFKQLEKNVRV